jgi:acyl carrier protein
MNRDEIYNRLNTIFRDVFDDASIALTEAMTAKEIKGWDSLTHIALLSAVEEEFSVRFSMKDVVGMKKSAIWPERDRARGL